MSVVRSPCLAVALSWAGLGMAACPSGTSLDRETESAMVGSTTAASTGTDGGDEDELRPVVCEAACSPVLVLGWTHEGEEGDQEASALARHPDGGWVVAVRRAAGGTRLVRLSAGGETEWSIAPQLPCDVCEPVDVEVLPSGDVLLSASVPYGIGNPAAIVARLHGDGTGLVWTRELLLFAGSNADSRAGQLAVLDDDRFALINIEGFSDSELVTVRELDGEGVTHVRRNVEVQRGSPGVHPLLAVAGPQGDLVLSYPWWNDEDDPENPQLEAITSRHLPPGYDEISALGLRLPLDALAIDGNGRRLELARSAGEQTSTLLLTSRSSSDVEGWSTSLPLVTTSSSRAVLAVGPGNEVYAAARTTPRAADDPSFVVELAVARWTSAGQLQWQASVPVDVLASDHPLELGIDEDDGVVLATVVQGRLRVSRYEQACACE